MKPPPCVLVVFVVNDAYLASGEAHEGTELNPMALNLAWVWWD